MAESAQNSGEWLAAARTGSPDALGKALHACQNYLLLIAGQELAADLHAKAGASDLVHDTFLDAQRDFAQFHGTSEAELLAWLRQILVNNVAKFTRSFRTRKREVNREVVLAADDSAGSGAPPVRDPTQTPSTQAVEREQAQALRRTMDQLPDDYRRVLVLRYVEGRSFEEIGPLLNRSADAARKLFARAMQQLKMEWEGSI